MRPTMLRGWWTFALLLMLGAPLYAATPTFPQLSGRVVDDAGILTPATRNGLVEMLAAHERATGQQVVVVTLKSLEGYSIEDYGYQLGRAWGIGQKDKNTGAVLIVAPNERKVRIEVGYGLEGTLTDAASRVIIEDQILPSFRTGDFNAGVVAGTAAILTVLGGDTTAAQPRAPRPTTVENSPVGMLLLMVIFFAFMFWRSRLSRGSMARGYLGGAGPMIYRGGGFGGGSGGGFSGGGGSFGGGGASGGW
ncbi:MAG TPA: TPM domain-containing protein [Candidatus Binataceae bacterium]|nr:TPM domain-containing protein [Candidatus Binataceae bacterium]